MCFRIAAAPPEQTARRVSVCHESWCANHYVHEPHSQITYLRTLLTVCVCVCERDRERKRESENVCVCLCVYSRSASSSWVCGRDYFSIDVAAVVQMKHCCLAVQ